MARLARVVVPGMPHHVTRRAHFRRGWRGHLWQGRFASFVLDEPYLLAAARHVELNPVRAQLATAPSDDRWSSTESGTGTERCSISTKGSGFRVQDFGVTV